MLLELIEKIRPVQTVKRQSSGLLIWQSRFSYIIRQKFIAATGREITTGMKVLLNGSASHHTLYGLSFSVNDLSTVFTLGDMERLRREIPYAPPQRGVIGLNKNASCHRCASAHSLLFLLAGQPDMAIL